MKHIVLLGCISIFCILFPAFSSQKPFNYKLKKVVIDAGHGGKDQGCAGGHSREKEITLNIALKLGEYIEKNLPDVEVIYTRKSDVFIELHERAAIANRNSADVFISIHCNASPTFKNAHGSETYIMGMDKSQENLDVARRENSVILMENNYEVNYDGFNLNNPESYIIFSLYQNAYLDQSIKLALMLENQFKERAKRKSRGVKQESFLVLYKTAMPSVLVETGFLTNLADEAYLNSKEGQTYMASSMYRALKEYKQMVEGNRASPANRGVSYFKPGNAEADIVTYRIQLYTAYESLDLGEPDFDAVEKIDIESGKNGIKHYLSGKKFTKHDKAVKYLEKMIEAGFKHAHIAIYEGNVRIED